MRSRSRTPPRRSGFSDKPRTGGFSDKPAQNTQNQPKMTTAEILEHYKQYNPNQNLSTYNKAERQLYVGNIPEGIRGEELSVILNKELQQLGKDVGIFQNGNPVTGAWISGDGHYAFVDFRTADEATQGFVLQQVQIKGSYLKVGRPKNATGIIPTPQQLLCGDPSFNPNNPGKGKGGSASIVQQALLQSKVMESRKGAEFKFNQRLLISGFPPDHSEKLIFELCNCFAKVVAVESVKDSHGKFDGAAYVDFESEFEAKQAFSSMMGLNVGSKVLYVKKMQPPTEEELIAQQRALGIDVSANEEVFKQIIEDKPTRCLVMKNIVSIQENHEPEDFKELEFDVQDELVKYGTVIRTHVPRPPKVGDPYSQKGFGKVYAKFQSESEAELAKKSIFKRRFNDRFIEVQYYSEDKFNKNVFE